MCLVCVKRETDRERERECVCVCECVRERDRVSSDKRVVVAVSSRNTIFDHQSLERRVELWLE